MAALGKSVRRLLRKYRTLSSMLAASSEDREDSPCRHRSQHSLGHSSGYQRAQPPAAGGSGGAGPSGAPAGPLPGLGSRSGNHGGAAAALSAERSAHRGSSGGGGAAPSELVVAEARGKAASIAGGCACAGLRLPHWLLAGGGADSVVLRT